MRKIMNIFAAALVMLAAASCEKNEVLPDNNSEGKVVTLKASINNGKTKASLDDKSGETYPVLWSEGDDIAVAQFGVSGVRVYKFTLTAGEGTPNGTFTCYDAVGFDPSLETNAVYPYTAQLDFLVVQTNQNYAEKSFDSDAILMMASMEEGSLKFNNILGILKLTITGDSDETVSSIELTANKPISGNAQFNDKTFIVTEGPYADYKNNIVLNCPNVAIDTEKEFLITVPAGTYDFAVTINTNKGTYYKSTTNKSIKESVILNMPPLDLIDFENSMPYVENGVYLGDGIALPAGEGKTIIWAPVNCGYDATHKYGLQYQWGRKYGQGYDGEIPAAVLENELLISVEAGSDEANKNNYYYKWLDSDDDYNMWYNNTPEATTTKTQYDPCPEGWRVPTNGELISLIYGLTEDHIKIGQQSHWTTISDSNDKHDGLTGLWFYGNEEEPTDSSPKVFFPAAGYRYYIFSTSTGRDFMGNYWSSSRTQEGFAWGLEFHNSIGIEVRSAPIFPNNGYSVRCVKE